MGRGATNVSSQDRRKATRVPLVQMIGTVDTITMISLFVLASLNIVSADNGTTLLMIVAHALLPVSALQFFALKKMVGLGHRILRFKLIGVKEDVSTFDMILRAVLRVSVSLMIVSAESNYNSSVPQTNVLNITAHRVPHRLFLLFPHSQRQSRQRVRLLTRVPRRPHHRAVPHALCHSVSVPSRDPVSPRRLPSHFERQTRPIINDD